MLTARPSESGRVKALNILPDAGPRITGKLSPNRARSLVVLRWLGVVGCWPIGATAGGGVCASARSRWAGTFAMLYPLDYSLWLTDDSFPPSHGKVHPGY